jgi:hypothetical protein
LCLAGVLVTTAGCINIVESELLGLVLGFGVVLGVVLVVVVGAPVFVDEDAEAGSAGQFVVASNLDEELGPLYK